MPKQGKPELRRLDSDVMESARIVSDGKSRWDDEKPILHNACIFSPKFDAKTGHYKSYNGKLYSGDLSFHESLCEAINDSVIGFPYHPKKSTTGKSEIRSAQDFTHITIPGSAKLDRSGDTPAIRADVEWVDMKDAKRARAGEKRLGFSVYVPEPLAYRDERIGRDIVACLDPEEKRMPTVDLVESPSATMSLAESVDPELSKENQAMTKEEIQAMLDAQEAKHAAEMKKLEGGIAESAKLKSELDGMKRSQLVQERLSAKKLAADNTTPALLKSLSLCESVEAMDKEIDAHKAVLAKQHDPINEAAAHARVAVIGNRELNVSKIEELTEAINEDGLNPVLKSLVGGESTSEARNRSFADKYPKSLLSRIANPRCRDAKTAKLRQAVLEAWQPKASLEILSGRSLSTVEDVSEAVLDSGSFSQTITGLLGAKVIDAYDITSAGFVSPSLMNIFQSSLKTETWVGYTQPSGMASVAEGGTYPDATMTDKYVGHPALTKYGVRVRITREEVLWDQKQQVLMRANSVGEGLAYDVEDRRIKALIDNATTTYYPSNVATALYTAGNGNLLAATPLIGDYTALESAATKLGQITDGNGRRLAANARFPLQILVPLSLQWAARHATMPTQQLRANGQSNITAGDNPFAGCEVYVSSVLDAVDPTSWYIAGMGGFKRQFGVKQNIPFEVVQLPQAEVQAVSADIIGGIRAAIMEAPFAWDYRYVVKCTAS